MDKFKNVSLADQVFEKLEDDIITGNYSRGEILTELRLVEELGVSRTPIREALRRLQQEHLIVETGKGSLVLGISDEDLRDIYIIRESLEGKAARRAAESATDEEIAMELGITGDEFLNNTTEESIQKVKQTFRKSSIEKLLTKLKDHSS